MSSFKSYDVPDDLTLRQPLSFYQIVSTRENINSTPLPAFWVGLERSICSAHFYRVSVLGQFKFLYVSHSTGDSNSLTAPSTMQKDKRLLDSNISVFVGTGYVH